MTAAGQKIASLMEESRTLFKVEKGSTAPEWLQYEHYIDDIVMNGLVESIRCR
jgi:hypothetical protein